MNGATVYKRKVLKNDYNGVWYSFSASQGLEVAAIIHNINNEATPS